MKKLKKSSLAYWKQQTQDWKVKAEMAEIEAQSLKKSCNALQKFQEEVLELRSASVRQEGHIQKLRHLLNAATELP